MRNAVDYDASGGEADTRILGAREPHGCEPCQLSDGDARNVRTRRDGGDVCGRAAGQNGVELLGFLWSERSDAKAGGAEDRVSCCELHPTQVSSSQGADPSYGRSDKGIELQQRAVQHNRRRRLLHGERGGDGGMEFPNIPCGSCGDERGFGLVERARPG